MSKLFEVKREGSLHSLVIAKIKKRSLLTLSFAIDRSMISFGANISFSKECAVFLGFAFFNAEIFVAFFDREQG